MSNDRYDNAVNPEDSLKAYRRQLSEETPPYDENLINRLMHLEHELATVRAEHNRLIEKHNHWIRGVKNIQELTWSGLDDKYVRRESAGICKRLIGN